MYYLVYGMPPLLLAVPLAIIETITFYYWHWPHRHLFPKRFRTALLAKGALKSVVLIGLTIIFTLVSPTLGWVYAIGHTVVGVVLHVYWCRKHDVDPIRVRPRERYVLASAGWIDKLIALEESRK